MKPVRSIVVSLFVAVVGIPALLGLAHADQVDSGINRPGGDYKNFEMEPSIAGYAPCESACTNATACKAWTFVQSGVQGPKAHCWLKNTIPPAVRDGCCVSGVRSQGCLIGGTLRTDIADADCLEAQRTGCIRHLLSDQAYAACLRAQPVISHGCRIGGVMRMDIADTDCQEAQRTGCIQRLLTQIQYRDCLAAQKTAPPPGKPGETGPQPPVK